MSELMDHSAARRNVLKHMILQLHDGKAPEEIRTQLVRFLGRIPYDEVVAVEQELIADGMPASEILSLCDLHSAAMKGSIDTSAAKTVPNGHPVHTFKMENQALLGEIALSEKLYAEIRSLAPDADAGEPIGQLRVRFSRLADIDKHYGRKENLVFPFLEKKGITGPPTVMWGKDDEVREMVRSAVESLRTSEEVTADDACGLIDLMLLHTGEAIKEMIFKEEEILFPMCLDKITDTEWYSIYLQSPEIGFCIYDPIDRWKPEGITETERETVDNAGVRFSTGALTPVELEAILNTIPFDLTFVGADDTVKYFTQGRERIFARNRAIIGRQVQMCHPPSSVHIVQKIIEDFRAGRDDRAPFWITLNGKFIHIEYFALRDEAGQYLGTLEVSQDLTEKRSLAGQQRLLSYEKGRSE